MKKVLFSVLSALALVACNNEQPSGVQYMPFQESATSGWGLIDSKGQVLFADEYANMPTVVMHNRFFVKNDAGRWELYTAEEKPHQVGDEYEQAGAFIEDVAPVVEPNGAIEFIDVNGEVKFTLDKVDGKDVASCTNFSEGVAIFKAGQYYGAINTKGDVIVEPEYIKIFPASDGKMLAVSKKFQDKLTADLSQIEYTILSTQGEEVGKLSGRKFRLASYAFKEGVIVVTDNSGNGEIRAGLVDVNGDWVVKTSSKIRYIKSIENKKFIYSDGDGYGLMNLQGEVIVRPRYVDLEFAGANGLLYAKRKIDGNYRLMDEKENELGDADGFVGFTPFISGNAAVHESAETWSFINMQGEDLKVKADVYSIRPNAYGDVELTNNYLNTESVLSALNFTPQGFLGLTLQNNAQQVAARMEGIAMTGKADAQPGTVEPSSYTFNTSVDAAFRVEDIPMTVSATFDETMAGTGFFNEIHPNQIGLEIQNAGMIAGRTGAVARSIIGKVKSFGQLVSENNNAAIVKVDDAAYFVANTGQQIYVVFGYLDIASINLDDYKDIQDKKVPSVDVDDVFGELNPVGLDETAATDAAVGSQAAQLLSLYADYVNQYAAIIKKATSGDASAMSEYAQLMQKTQQLSQQIESEQAELTAEQLEKYAEITEKFVEMVSEME